MFRLIKLIVEFLNNLDKRGTTNGSIPTINSEDKSNLKKLFIIVPVFFGILAILSSIYTIDPGEVGVVQRFGKFSSYILLS